MERKAYQIGGQKYWQEPLSMGQLEYLMPMLKALEVKQDLGELSIPGLLAGLGGQLPKLFAVVLVPDGQTRGDVVRELDRPGGLDERAARLKSELDLEVAMKVVNDFFVCNPVAPLLAKLLSVFDQKTPEPSGPGAQT